MRHGLAVVGLFALLIGLSQPALAQKFEIHPYAGGLFPGDWRDLELKDEGVYGLKGGVFLSDQVQLEGNLGYINHFEFRNTDPRSRAFIWEGGPSFNFFTGNIEGFVPYLNVSAGGVTGFIGDVEDVADNSADSANIAPPGTPELILDDGGTFFQFSYGGGIKGLELWGPLGLRADVRGRTMPNFFGSSVTWLETTGGITFSWGER
jgi:hypothetical protein